MSANDSHPEYEEAHNGPIKTPKQFLAMVFFSFIVPVLAIIGLVFYVASANKPSAGADDISKTAAQRIRKIGSVEIRDANRTLKTGEEVYKGQCVACHGIGAAGSPKFGDESAWAPRIKTGYAALLNSALHGKGAMGAQGGGDFEELEIGRAVVYMTSAAGGKFPEPVAPTAPVAAASGPADAAAAGPSKDVVAALAAANKGTAIAAAPAATGAVIPVLYTQVCVACHAAGVAGAPKLGDKASWAPRIALGVDALTASVVKGKGAMPPRGGSTASDVEIKTVVQYMVSTAK